MYFDIVIEYDIRHHYKRQTSSVCYGAKNDTFGSFSLQHTGYLVELILKHQSGFLSCRVPDVGDKSKWGCYDSTFLNVLITDHRNKIIFPSTEKIKNKKFLPALFYDYQEGYTQNMDVLVFTTDYVSRPKYWKKGQELRIWNWEDLANLWDHNNNGTHCVQVISTTIQHSYVKD